MSSLIPPDRLPGVAGERAEPPVLRSTLTPGYGESRAEGVPLREYLGALRRYWWLLAASVAVAVGIAAWRLHQELPRYLATTAVRLVDPTVRMSGDLAAGAADPTLQGVYHDPILSQIQVLRSRAVAGTVVDSLGLRLKPVRPDFAFAPLASVAVDPSAPSGDTVRVTFGAREATARLGEAEARAPYGAPLALPGVTLVFSERPEDGEALFTLAGRDDAINEVLGGLQANPRDATNVLDIVYTAYDPTLAKRVADGMAVAFQEANAQSAQQETRRRRLFIQEQLRSTDSLLLIAQRELSTFRKSVQAFSPRERFKTTQEGLGQLRLQREALAGERRIYDRMAAALGDRTRAGNEQMAALAAAPEVANNVGIQRLYDQLVRYQTARDSMVTGPFSASPTNPDVVRMDSLLTVSRSRLGSAVEARSTALAAQMGVLDELIASDAASIRALPDAEAEEMRLARQVETLQTLVDDLLREQQKARIDEAVEAGQVDILDYALLPGGPIGRGAERRLFFALLVGLMIGAGGAMALDRLNTAIVRREEVELQLHVPALAIIPRIGEPAEGRKRLRVPGSSLVKRLPEGSAALITVSDLHSSPSQAYRKLRTHLLFSAGAGRNGASRMRTLMVTSPGAAEGKSTICSNLAVTFAQQHLRVALIDGDLRRSRIHNVFGVQRLPGLTEVLRGEASLEDALRPTAVEGLDVVPAGRLVPNASELLGSQAMHRLLEALAARYDLVIVDTPPVLAAADAEILGVQTDAVLVVVRAGQTDRQSAQYAVQQLRGIGAHVVGAVLNDPDRKVPGYGRYGYYYDDYAVTAEA